MHRYLLLKVLLHLLHLLHLLRELGGVDSTGLFLRLFVHGDHGLLLLQNHHLLLHYFDLHLKGFWIHPILLLAGSLAIFRL